MPTGPIALHSDQSTGGVRNTSETPDFLRTSARECIDAEADAFVVTGPHVFRGVEIYDGRPIFYSLGNLFYQTETVVPVCRFDGDALDSVRLISVLSARTGTGPSVGHP